MNKKYFYILITDRIYPNGGGEEFAFETVKYTNSLNIKSLWITFSCNKSESEIINYCDLIMYSKYIFNSKFIYNVIESYNPKILHYIGSNIHYFNNININPGIFIFVGIHFWKEILNYNKQKFYDIFNNKISHSLTSHMSAKFPYYKKHKITRKKIKLKKYKIETKFSIENKVGENNNKSCITNNSNRTGDQDIMNTDETCITNNICNTNNTDETYVTNNTEETYITNTEETYITNTDETCITNNTEETYITNTEETYITNTDETCITNNTDETCITNNTEETYITNTEETCITNNTDDICVTNNTDETCITNNTDDICITDETYITNNTDENCISDNTDEICISDNTDEICISDNTDEICITDNTDIICISDNTDIICISDNTDEISISEYLNNNSPNISNYNNEYTDTTNESVYSSDNECTGGLNTCSEYNNYSDNNYWSDISDNTDSNNYWSDNDSDNDSDNNYWSDISDNNDSSDSNNNYWHNDDNSNDISDNDNSCDKNNVIKTDKCNKQVSYVVYQNIFNLLKYKNTDLGIYTKKIIFNNKIQYYVPSTYVFLTLYKLYNFDINNINLIIPVIEDVNKINLSKYSTNNIYITCINTNFYKCGYLLLNLLKYFRNSDIKFCVINTKKHKNNDIIKNQILENEGLYLNYIDNIQEIYANTKILLIPSLVDETFCRVAYEGCKLGIPIITSGLGNFSELGMFSKLYSIDIINKSSINLWYDEICSLYHNNDKLISLSNLSLEIYNDLNKKYFFDKIFNKFSFSHYLNLFTNRFLFIAPYSQCGLFYSVCNYAQAIKTKNSNAYITLLTYKPYYLTENNEELNLTYFDEIIHTSCDYKHIKITKKYKTFGNIIIPELLFEIKYHNNIIYIPNIDTSNFNNIKKLTTNNYKILANSFYSKNYMFNKYNITSNFIGFSLPFDIKMKPKITVIKFLLVGGALKNILPVVETFYKLYKDGIRNIHLFLTVTNVNKKIHETINLPIITKLSNLLKQEIIDLYHTCHVSIISSKSEGLGLNIYESIKTGTPILTHYGYEEIIKDNINGWLCEKKTIIDDNIIHEIDQNDLYNKIINISKFEQDYYNDFIKKCINYNQDNFNYDSFCNRFYDEIIK